MKLRMKNVQKSGLKGDLEQDDAPVGVIDPEVERELPNRNHKDLEGHEISGDEERQDQEATAELVERKPGASQRRQNRAPAIEGSVMITLLSR
jgi:hypothetical protein